MSGPVDILQLLQYVSQAGAVAAPIFLFLWWDERAQRMAKEAKIEAMAERTITAMVEFKGLLEFVVDLINRKPG